MSESETLTSGMVRIRFTLNGDAVELVIPSDTSVLHLLRDHLGLTGTKEGCGVGECGACTVIMDGKAVNACLMLAAQLDGRTLETVEGMGNADALHPIQEAFVTHHAVQCGFCTPGLLMSTKALLDRNPAPERDEIVRAVSGNLCRCTGYHHIREAIDHACRCRASEKEPS